MKTPLAWFNLLHNRVRTLVAVAGVTFAIVLIFMQLGFLEALKSTATVIYDALDFDICIRSKDYLHLASAGTFPRARMYQAASTVGVVQVTPFYVLPNLWRSPPHSSRPGENRGILVMGVQPGLPTFRVAELQRAVDTLLVSPDVMLIDQRTRPEYGPINGVAFGDEDVQAGVETELGGQRARLVGYFRLGTGFSANGAVLVTDRGFLRAAPGRTAEDVTLGLVQLPKSTPPATVREIAGRIKQRITADVDVLTREEVRVQELNYWVRGTSFGLIFQVGVGIALIVGGAIVYQVLASDVANMLPEYATLKAMGYSDGYLGGIVVRQAAVLAVVSYGCGFVLALGLYFVTSRLAGIPIQMTPGNAVLVFGLSVAMCTVSSIGAVRKMFRADPADLF